MFSAGVFSKTTLFFFVLLCGLMSEPLMVWFLLRTSAIEGRFMLTFQLISAIGMTSVSTVEDFLEVFFPSLSFNVLVLRNH